MPINFFTAVLLVVPAVASLAAERHLHVAPEPACASSLACDGSSEAPFSTVFQARDAIRRLPVTPGEKITVHVSGQHWLPQPFVLEGADSRPASSPVIYQGAPDASSRLSGGIKIPYSAFKPATVPSKAAGVVQASLFDIPGINSSVVGEMSNPHPNSLMELFVQGKPQTLSRDPNIASDGTWMWAGYEHVIDSKPNGFNFTDTATAQKWLPAIGDGDGLWLHGYWKFDWRDTYVQVASITPSGSGYFVANNPKTPPQYPFTNGCRFYAVDSIHFLDTASEYYIDRKAGILYYLPAEPLTADTEVVVSVLGSVVESTANHTSFSNMVISDSRGATMSLSGEGFTVDSCTVSNSGGPCLSVTGSQNSVHNSTVFGCGTSGVSLSGGDRYSLTHGNSSATNNLIANFSRIVRTYEPGVRFDGVGLYVANNTIENGPHCAITGGGNDNLFEFNHINHASYECTDTGAFYVGRSWSQRGNVFRYNLIERVRPSERLAQKSCSQNAFYLDDEMSGWEVYGNTFQNSTTGLLLGGGRRNKIYNNKFIDNDKDIAFDDRGLTWQSAYCNKTCPGQPACFYHDLERYHYQQPPYSVKYPEIVNIFDDHPCVPVGNEIHDNVYCHEHSKAGAEFIDKTPAQVTAWLSKLYNNTEHCDS